MIKEKLKRYREQRRRKVHKFSCPICRVEMKRKGKKGSNEYYKCPKCKGRIKNGFFQQAPNPDSIDMRNHELKMFRKEIAKRRLIIQLKKEKYLGYDTFQWEGEMIHLPDYDVDGISFEEKQRQEEERKRQEKELKKAQKKKAKEEKKKQKEIQSKQEVKN